MKYMFPPSNLNIHKFESLLVLVCMEETQTCASSMYFVTVSQLIL